MFLGAAFVPLNINLRCDLASWSSEGAQLISVPGHRLERVQGVKTEEGGGLNPVCTGRLGRALQQGHASSKKRDALLSPLNSRGTIHC